MSSRSSSRVSTMSRTRKPRSRTAPDRTPDEPDELPVLEGLRSGSIDGAAGLLAPNLDADPCDVVDVHGLDSVPAAAGDPVDRQASERPRKVVDEDVVVAVRERRTD